MDFTFLFLWDEFRLLKILPIQKYWLHGLLSFQDILQPSANLLPAPQHRHFHESSVQALFLLLKTGHPQHHLFQLQRLEMVLHVL